MNENEHKKWHDDATLSEAMHIIAEREESGENALDEFIVGASAIMTGKTLMKGEY